MSAKIEFSNGFTIIPNGGTPIVGPGNYQLTTEYRPAINNGEIIIPDHPNNTYSLDFNIVGGTYQAAIYINLKDILGNDNSSYLNQLIGNHTHLTFSQGDYHITFDCEATAWESPISGVYCFYDPNFGAAPDNSVNMISTSDVAFNTTEPITITIVII